jgi:hypothetical protein
VKNVIHRIPRKAISHLSQQLAICIGAHRILRQNNEELRPSDQLCRPLAVVSEHKSRTVKNTGLTDGAHCYVNGIVNNRNESGGTQKSKFLKTLHPNKQHSLARFV